MALTTCDVSVIYCLFSYITQWRGQEVRQRVCLPFVRLEICSNFLGEECMIKFGTEFSLKFTNRTKFLCMLDKRRTLYIINYLWNSRLNIESLCQCQCLDNRNLCWKACTCCLLRCSSTRHSNVIVVDAVQRKLWILNVIKVGRNRCQYTRRTAWRILIRRNSFHSCVPSCSGLIWNNNLQRETASLGLFQCGPEERTTCCTKKVSALGRGFNRECPFS